LTPDAWVGFLPQWVDVFGPERVLILFSLFEILFVLWLFSGNLILASSLVSFLIVGGIILQNIGALDIVFRDISILFIALVLAITHYDSDRGRIAAIWNAVKPAYLEKTAAKTDPSFLPQFQNRAMTLLSFVLSVRSFLHLPKLQNCGKRNAKRHDGS